MTKTLIQKEITKDTGLKTTNIKRIMSRVDSRITEMRREIIKDLKTREYTEKSRCSK